MALHPKPLSASAPPPSPLPLQALADTRRWLERAVIGLNLCPFARAVYASGQIHFALTPATSAGELLDELERQAQALLALDASVRDTTLLIAPAAFPEFADFNDFLALADIHLRLLGLQGQLQIASFHPRYCFAGSPESDIANATNRAPHPTLHLLREASVSRAVAAHPDTSAIVARNLHTLQTLGHAGWQALGVGA